MSPQRKVLLLAVVFVYVSALSLLGCSAPAAAPPPTQGVLTVADIDVGRSVATDNTLVDKTDTFRPGDYKVEIVLNGVSAGTEKFKVQ